MRTTINLPDDLLADLKRLAVASRTTLTALIEDALRDTLSKRRRKARKKREELPTYGEQGLQPGVDLDDTAALLDHMEPPVGAPRR